jgi:hypothetical protein
MRQLIFYIPILAAIILPLVFRKSPVARVCSVGLLCLVAVFYVNLIILMPRLIREDGYREFTTGDSVDLPPPYVSAVNHVRAYTDTLFWPFLALIVGFAVLALLPSRNKKE